MPSSPVHELVEVLQRLGRVGGRGEEMRELLDQHDDEAQLLLTAVGSDLAAAAAAETQLVLHLAADAPYVDPVQVEIAHGQGVGQAVQEARRVLGGNVHDRPVGRGVVVDVHLHRKQPSWKAAAGSAKGVDEPVVEGVARLLLPALALELDQRGQEGSEGLLGGGVKRVLGVEVDGEQVHDQPARRMAAPRRQAFRSAPVAEHLPLADVEPAGGHGAGDEGKRARQVITHKQNVGARGAARRHPHLQWMPVVDGRHQPQVAGDLLGAEEREVFLVQLVEEVVKHLSVHPRTAARHLAAQRAAVRCRRGFLGLSRRHVPHSMRNVFANRLCTASVRAR